jgi:hypothetical protein
MASVRFLSNARILSRYAQTRSISTSRTLRNEPTPNLGSAQPQKKPVGGFRGGCVHQLFMV